MDQQLGPDRSTFVITWKLEMNMLRDAADERRVVIASEVAGENHDPGVFLQLDQQGRAHRVDFIVDALGH
ncbi:hypothetical protein D3C85_1130990 [compost metagenome]